MSLNIIVLAKQVPDTRNVGKDAMKADGTINRAALPAIFNPEDLNALEQALKLKEMYPGSKVTLLTMGPARAAEIVREGMFRGADGVIVLSALSPAATRSPPPTLLAPLFAKSVISTSSSADARPSTATLHRLALRLPRNLEFLKSHMLKTSSAPTTAKLL